MARLRLLISEREAKHPSLPPPAVDECRHVFYSAVQEQQLAQFGTNFEEYLLAGARDLLQLLSQQRNKKVVLVTANEQPQAEWVTEKVDIAKYFTDVIGYPTVMDEGQSLSKATIMADYLQRCVPPSQCIVGLGGRGVLEWPCTAGAGRLPPPQGLRV